LGEVGEYLGDVNWEKIAKQILNTPSIIDPMIAAILAKKEREEAAILAKKQKQTKKIRVVNHIAATAKNPEDRILGITEGLSAIGSLLECRESSEYIGGYPLKGKLLNVRGMKPIDILKNKEIFELLAIIGLEFGKPATNLNYGKIAIMTDSDVDGHHCRGLILNLLSYWPELFEEERVCQIKTPLYICTKGKDVKWFYNKSEYDSANLRGYSVEYCKGLGSLPKEVYKECINNPQLVIFKNSDSFDSLELGFGGDAESRKKWMMA
jgi:DNA topoisomerase-2